MAVFGEVAWEAVFGHGSTISKGAVVTVVAFVGSSHCGGTAGQSFARKEAPTRPEEAPERLTGEFRKGSETIERGVKCRSRDWCWRSIVCSCEVKVSFG